MAKKGLRSWVKENWVDIANKRPDGSYPKCGRSGGEKRKKYPKCVPIAKARAMSKGQRAGAVRRKQAKANTGPTPSRAATFAKKKKKNNLINIIERNNLKIGSITLAEDYGTEHFCFLLYSLIRMQRPQNVIELGCGYGCVSTILAQALKENEKGKVWCVDNQHDWPLMKEKLKKIGEDHNTYEEYFDYLKNKFNLKDYMEYINITINAESHNFFHVNKPIDLLFSDASDSGPNGCIQTLSFYLPKMSEYADIFIDRASTLNHSFLTLEYIIDNLQKGKIPKILLKFKTEEEINHMYNFVKKSKFTLIHLAESSEKKANRHQNSTAWIKIEPLDVFIGNNVENYI